MAQEGVAMTLVRIKECGKCQGDLIADEDEWRCVQCGTHYYPEDSESPPDPSSLEEEKRREKSAYNNNARIDGRTRSEESWWKRNKKIIKDLDRKMSIKDIAEKFGKSRGTISRIKGELRDLCAQDIS